MLSLFVPEYPGTPEEKHDQNYNPYLPVYRVPLKIIAIIYRFFQYID